MVEKNFSVAKALGDRAALMDDVRAICTGAMAELAENKDLQERLMGLSMEVQLRIIGPLLRGSA